MANERDPGPRENEVPRDSYDDAEAQLGGADSVEKTTYVVGSGTDPEARSRPGVPSARVATGGIRSAATWVVVGLVVLVLVGYLIGMFRS
jgi:hypothetical protein